MYELLHAGLGVMESYRGRDPNMGVRITLPPPVGNKKSCPHDLGTKN